MTRRARVLAFGSAGLGVIAGLTCVALFDGLTAEVIAIALITAGLGAAVLLVFFEVGLSEDRERAKAERRQEPRTGPRHEDARRPHLRRRPRRPGGRGA